MANRQIARDLSVSPTTVDRMISRMGRHCLLFHAKAMESAPPMQTIVIDGFETFELSQYFPFHHNLAVEKETDFFIYFTDSELRRKGRMTAYQKKRREELELLFGRPDSTAVGDGIGELLDYCLRGTESATVHSDNHPAYRRPISRSKCQIEHIVTSGKDHRGHNNNLWEINLLDLLIRHCGANHKRETIAWSKRRQSSAERLAIFLVWRNYQKRRREKNRASPTPAMERGMFERALNFDDVFERRIFRQHIDLPPRWSLYYEREVLTRALAINQNHGLKKAS